MENIAGFAGHVTYDAIPGVIYTHPDLATMRQTEEELIKAGVTCSKGTFPSGARPYTTTTELSPTTTETGHTGCAIVATDGSMESCAELGESYCLSSENPLPLGRCVADPRGKLLICFLADRCFILFALFSGSSEELLSAALVGRSACALSDSASREARERQKLARTSVAERLLFQPPTPRHD